MKSRWWLNIFLLLIVAFLGSWVYLKSRPVDKVIHALSQIQPNDVNTVVIEKKGGAPLHLKKESGQWIIVSPFTARADAIKLQTLMSLLNFKSNTRLPATDLSRFDLDKPELKITFNQQIFSLGTLNQLTMERYIATNDAVFLVTLPFGPEIAAQPYSFVSKQLLAENERPTSFQLSKFTLSFDKDRWNIQPPTQKLILSQDTFNQWVDYWRFMPAQLTEPGKTDSKGEIVKIKLENDKIISFIVKQQDPAIILLRQDENIQYSFPKESGEKLLQSPDTGN